MCTDQIRCLIHGHDREGLSILKAALVLEPRKAPLHCTGAWRSSSEQGLQCVRGFKGLVWLQGNFLAPVLCASEASWPLYSSRDLKALSGSHTLGRPAERPNFGGGGEEQCTLVIVTIYTNLDSHKDFCPTICGLQPRLPLLGSNEVENFLPSEATSVKGEETFPFFNFGRRQRESFAILVLAFLCPLNLKGIDQSWASLLGTRKT